MKSNSHESSDSDDFNLSNPLIPMEESGTDSDDDFNFSTALKKLPKIPRTRKPKFIVTIEMQMEFLSELIVDDTKQAMVASSEQKTDEWLNARRFRVTGSRVGSILGHNFFQKPSDVLESMLYPQKITNAAMEWGCAKEDTACAYYERFLKKYAPNHKIEIKHTGLHVMKSKPWIGASPDGIVWVDGVPRLILEIKAPYSKRDKGFGRSVQQVFTSYFDQITLLNYVFRETYPTINGSDFWQWTPRESKFQRIEHSRKYEKELVSKAEKWYYHELVPRIILLKSRQFSKNKQISIPAHVEIQYLPEKYWF